MKYSTDVMVLQDPLLGWKQYPDETYEAHEDAYLYRTLLEQKAESIFTTDPANTRLEVLYTQAVGNEQSSPSRTVIDKLQDLESFLRECRLSILEKVYFLSQKDTRSRLQLTLEMYCLLCHANRIMPRYIDIVASFGYKLSNTDEYFTTCYRDLHVNEDTSNNCYLYAGYELCCNIRFVERHGRTGFVDPWEFRQTAIYQYYGFSQGRSTYMLIQIPPTAKINIEAMLEDASKLKKSSPLRLHLLLLKDCAKNWRWYLNYMSDILRETRDDVIWAGIDQPRQSKTLSFDRSQDLEKLRWKLQQICAILESNIDVANTIHKHAEDLTSSIETHRPEASQDHWRLKSHLLEYIANQKMHRRKALDLIDSIRSIDTLILKLLDLRNYGISNNNALSLKDIAEATADENKHMVQIAKMANQESRTMKITSFITVIFLPATLLSSIFSTDLLSNLSKSQKDSSSSLVTLYVILTVVLTGATVAAVYVWDRNAARVRKAQKTP